MNATVMVCTKLSEKSIVTTYINIEGDTLYPMSITLSEPPWHPIGNPEVPENVGGTATTIHRHDHE